MVFLYSSITVAMLINGNVISLGLVLFTKKKGKKVRERETGVRFETII